MNWMKKGKMMVSSPSLIFLDECCSCSLLWQIQDIKHRASPNKLSRSLKQSSMTGIRVEHYGIRNIRPMWAPRRLCHTQNLLFGSSKSCFWKHGYGVVLGITNLVAFRGRWGFADVCGGSSKWSELAAKIEVIDPIQGRSAVDGCLSWNKPDRNSRLKWLSGLHVTYQEGYRLACLPMITAGPVWRLFPNCQSALWRMLFVGPKNGIVASLDYFVVELRQREH